QNEVDSYAHIVKKLETEGAPKHLFADRNADQINVYEIKQPILIVHFWASWCAPCIEEFPSIIRMTKDFPDIYVLAVSLDESFEEHNAFLSSLQVEDTENFKVSRGEANVLTQLYGVDKLPE